MKFILFGHFYNEEYLLPEWVNHHKNIFDKAVLFDYNSTDNSVDIIKSLAPHWEIRKSRNDFFDSQLINDEIQDAEREFTEKDTWKICLNTTENLFTKDIRKVIQDTDPSISAISCYGISLCDIPEMVNVEISSPLLKQRHFGFTNVARFRLLHKLEDGRYARGRHGFVDAAVGFEAPEANTSRTPFILTNKILIINTLYSPMTEKFLNRKLQIKSRMPLIDIVNLWGGQHLMTKEQMIADYHEKRKLCSELLEFEPYKEIYNNLYNEK